ALAAKQGQLDVLQQADHQLENEYQAFARLHAWCSQIAKVECGEYIQQMLTTQRQLQQAEKRLEDLDLTDFKEIELRLEQLRDTHTQLETTSDSLSEQLGALNKTSESLSKAIQKIAEEQDTLQEQQERCQRAVI